MIWPRMHGHGVGSDIRLVVIREELERAAPVTPRGRLRGGGGGFFSCDDVFFLLAVEPHRALESSRAALAPAEDKATPNKTTHGYAARGRPEYHVPRSLALGLRLALGLALALRWGGRRWRSVRYGADAAA